MYTCMKILMYVYSEEWGLRSAKQGKLEKKSSRLRPFIPDQRDAAGGMT